MVEIILIFFKKIIPQPVFKIFQPIYHFALGYLAAFWYGNPSQKMTVIGITGTTGKTTTSYLLARILNSAGLKTGYFSTAMFSDGEKEWLNDRKMTMPGRFFAQKLLREMVKNKCDVAIVETTSQGIVQFRHRFINYDVLIFTGLYPEHIEAHGSFENYKKTKGELFAHLERCREKFLRNKKIIKTIIINADDEHAQYFSSFWAERKIFFTSKEALFKDKNAAEIIKADNIKSSVNGLQFTVDGVDLQTSLLGDFNVSNLLAVISAAKALDIPVHKIKNGLEKITGIPGRLEKIPNTKGFTIIVDYAFEPKAMLKLYETVKKIPHQKIIHVLGSCGGGRDRWRRPELGKLAGQKADYVIVTNEDPYDEDPMKIIDEVFEGVIKKGTSNQASDLNPELRIVDAKVEKVEDVSSWRIMDRREAIKKALKLAQKNDLVLITGKGCEQAICVEDGKKIKWDDRAVVREELGKL